MKSKKKKGLTLIEIIVSLAILGIIIAPILSLTLTTVKISKSSENKILATNLAQQCTEYIKSAVIINDSFLGSLQSDVGLVENNDDKLKELMKNEDKTPFKLYTLPEKSQYKNFITKISYKIDNETPIDENSDNSDYDMIITVDSVNKISIMNNKNIQQPSSGNNVFSEGNPRPIIKIINNESDVECSVKLGDVYVFSGVKINKKLNTIGKVKIIFQSTNNINVDINAENMESSDPDDNQPPNGNLALKVLKTSNSNYDYTVVENDGVNSENISEQYEIFDITKIDPNKLMKSYLVNIEEWYYDSKSNTKILMQQVKTYKTL